MSKELTLTPGEIYLLSAIVPDDAGDLMDLTGWSASYVGRDKLKEGAVIFTYTEQDSVEFGVFPGDDGKDRNIRFSIPSSMTAELHSKGYKDIYVGLLISPPDGSSASPEQVVPACKIGVKNVIAL